MIFNNTIYQISNISAIEAGEVYNPLYTYALNLGLASIFAILLGFGEYGVLGLVLAVVLYVFFYFTREYGLIIRLNSGFTQLIKNKDLEFIKDVALVIQSIMDNEEEERSITFYLDKRQIVDNVSKSNIVLGSVGGDIINRV